MTVNYILSLPNGNYQDDSSKMRYKLFRDKASLGSHTSVIEVGPGRYSGKHYQTGFVFIDEDAFIYAEASIRKHFSAYDHYDMNDITRQIGEAILQDWRVVAKKILLIQKCDLKDELPRFSEVHECREVLWDKERNNIAKMLNELADFVEDVLKDNMYFCILGL